MRCSSHLFHVVILFQASEDAAVDYRFALASFYGSTWPQQDHNTITWVPGRRRALASGLTPLQQSENSSAECGASPLSSRQNPSGLWKGSTWMPTRIVSRCPQGSFYNNPASCTLHHRARRIQVKVPSPAQSCVGARCSISAPV